MSNKYPPNYKLDNYKSLLFKNKIQALLNNFRNNHYRTNTQKYSNLLEYIGNLDNDDEFIYVIQNIIDLYKNTEIPENIEKELFFIFRRSFLNNENFTLRKMILIYFAVFTNKIKSFSISNNHSEITNQSFFVEYFDKNTLQIFNILYEKICFEFDHNSEDNQFFFDLVLFLEHQNLKIDELSNFSLYFFKFIYLCYFNHSENLFRCYFASIFYEGFIKNIFLFKINIWLEELFLKHNYNSFHFFNFIRGILLSNNKEVKKLVIENDFFLKIKITRKILFSLDDYRKNYDWERLKFDYPDRQKSNEQNEMQELKLSILCVIFDFFEVQNNSKINFIIYLEILNEMLVTTVNNSKLAVSLSLIFYLIKNFTLEKDEELILNLKNEFRLVVEIMKNNNFPADIFDLCFEILIRIYLHLLELGEESEGIKDNDNYKEILDYGRFNFDKRLELKAKVLFEEIWGDK